MAAPGRVLSILPSILWDPWAFDLRILFYALNSPETEDALALSLP